MYFSLLANLQKLYGMEILLLLFITNKCTCRKFIWPNPEYRLEKDGEIMEAGVDALLTHVQTGKPLSAASDETFVVRFVFG